MRGRKGTSRQLHSPVSALSKTCNAPKKLASIFIWSNPLTSKRCKPFLTNRAHSFEEQRAPALSFGEFFDRCVYSRKLIVIECSNVSALRHATSGGWGNRVILPSLSSSEGTVDSPTADTLLALGSPCGTSCKQCISISAHQCLVDDYRSEEADASSGSIRASGFTMSSASLFRSSFASDSSFRVCCRSSADLSCPSSCAKVRTLP